MKFDFNLDDVICTEDMNYKGFATKKEAKWFIKNHGGFLSWAERTGKTSHLTDIGEDYMTAVKHGLDSVRFPYCVEWVSTNFSFNSSGTTEMQNFLHAVGGMSR